MGQQKLNEINYKVGPLCQGGSWWEGVHNETITKHATKRRVERRAERKEEKETNNKTNRCDWISVNNANEFRLESLARVYPRFLHLYIRRICACHPTHTSTHTDTHTYIQDDDEGNAQVKWLNGVSRKARAAELKAIHDDVQA